MEFRKAVKADVDSVCRLYRAAATNPFSVWNEEYPSRLEAEHDLETNNLFVLVESGELIGTISIVPENEMDDLTVWNCSDLPYREIARIAVSPAYQGRGLATFLIENVFSVLREGGYRCVRLSAACCNVPACKTYTKLGFAIHGEADMYGSHYFLMEKEI